MNKKNLIIIPTYNELKNIQKLIPDIISRYQNTDILIVDDNSPDGTGDYIFELTKTSPKINLIKRPEKKGLGTAYIEGFKFALQKDYDFIFEMDADYSHDPKEIKNFLINSEKYDLIIGSRYIAGGKIVNWPKNRLILSRLANFYTRIVTRLPVCDATGGFKCFKRKVIESLDLNKIKSNGYAFQIEINFKAWKNGFRIHEIPIIFSGRAEGVSKISKKNIFEAILIVLELRIEGALALNKQPSNI